MGPCGGKSPRNRLGLTPAQPTALPMITGSKIHLSRLPLLLIMMVVMLLLPPPAIVTSQSKAPILVFPPVTGISYIHFVEENSKLVAHNKHLKMGSMMAKAMDENFQKNKEFMQGIQETMLERQIQMQNQMREKSVAMQLSGSREMFNWIASFYGVVTVTCLAGFMKRKNPAVLIPLLPLTFIVAYQYDYTYGTKVLRIREGAEAILKEERQLLPVPLGLPNLASIDAARDATKSS